ncbi:MAG: hypothetical protein VYE40_19640 [Myxococcota bacterium]|nr:hypothetical protein [Myxococcota bacterium]
MRSRFLLFLPSLLLSSLSGLIPSVASADVLECDSIALGRRSGEMHEVVPHRFGKDKVLVVDRCSVFAGHAYYEVKYSVSVWKDGERLITQDLERSIVTDAGNNYVVDEGKQKVTLSLGCGDVYSEDADEQAKMCDTSFVFSERHGLLLPDARTTSESLITAEMMNGFDDALKKDDIEAARKLLATFSQRLDYTQNSRWFAQQHLRFLEVVRKKALEAHEAKKQGEVLELARLLFDEPSPSWGVVIEDEHRYRDIIQLGHNTGLEALRIGSYKTPDSKPEDPRSVRVILLPKSERTTLVLNDLLFFLAGSQDIEDIRRALEPMHELSRRVPERMILHLNIGDACWSYLHHPRFGEEGEEGIGDKAVSWMIYHYKQYVAKPTSNTAAKRARERVNKTIDALEQKKK